MTTDTGAIATATAGATPAATPPAEPAAATVTTASGTLTDRPDTSRVLASLKPFQRATVEYAFERLWGADDPVDRFLVADEVGLGKTMVAKGVIAKTVDALWETTKRIDIVYICSNRQIARQNLRRLNVVGGNEVHHADRLSMLPLAMRDMNASRINFVSFSPATSFAEGSTGGKAPERIMLYWLLADVLGETELWQPHWRKFFAVGVDYDRFSDALREFRESGRDRIGPEFVDEFGTALVEARDADGRPLLESLAAGVAGFTGLVGKSRPADRVVAESKRLISRLRRLVARIAVKLLEPDLVILDEFQRFKDVLDGDDEGAELARAVFGHDEAKVLLLSATPYKMYTLPDEPDGDDHYRDFTRTVRFLAGEARASGVERDLRTMREHLVAGRPRDEAVEARDRVQHELRRVMCRTERLSSTPDRDGMLVERQLPGLELTPGDVTSFAHLDRVAKRIDRHDVFEYWRSTPYLINLMDKGSYALRRGLEAAGERRDTELTRLLREAKELLEWRDIEEYRRIDPGNAKLRGVGRDVLDRGSWKLLWLPPSQPYSELGGAYAEPELRSFTKRLIFSAWAVVPKAVALLLSYETERRTLEHARARRPYDRTVSPPLRFQTTADRQTGMPALAALAPSLVLAEIGDPLEIARTLGGTLPISQDRMREVVRARVTSLLGRLPAGEPGVMLGPDQRWYWAAPFLLGELLKPDEHRALGAAMRRNPEVVKKDHDAAIIDHLDLARTVGDLQLGARPDDLVDVLTSMAIGGPGVCALRALSRVCGGPESMSDPAVQDAAVTIAWGLRSMFNRPEIAPLLRAGGSETYWRAVIEHGVEGCLQAVLDEYAHVLVESLGLQDAGPADRAAKIAGAMHAALALPTTSNTVTEVHAMRRTFELNDAHRMRSHFAARFGHAESSDAGTNRDAALLAAYNSPFRPFVLATTSVGQEGLDFHQYSHAIVHWNLPGNPVDLEQREGRVHRYKGHAVRKNIAAAFGGAALDASVDDPWSAMFAAAEAAELAAGDASSGLRPYWVFTRPGGAVIERYVPAMPLSRESQLYRRLQRTVGAYRMVIGQPRQADLVRYAGEDSEWMGIDLAPGGGGA